MMTGVSVTWRQHLYHINIKHLVSPTFTRSPWLTRAIKPLPSRFTNIHTNVHKHFTLIRHDTYSVRMEIEPIQRRLPGAANLHGFRFESGLVHIASKTGSVAWLSSFTWQIRDLQFQPSQLKVQQIFLWSRTSACGVLTAMSSTLVKRPKRRKSMVSTNGTAIATSIITARLTYILVGLTRYLEVHRLH